MDGQTDRQMWHWLWRSNQLVTIQKVRSSIIEYIFNDAQRIS